MLGTGWPPKVSKMNSDSRKAQLSSFAHHRASLLFSTHLARRGDANQWSAAVHEGTEPPAVDDLARRIVADIRGFIATTAVAA